MPKLRNKFEKKIDKQLRLSKVFFSYETERLPYTISGVYIPDFILTFPSKKIYIEAKGYLRPEHKRKMVAVLKANPELDLRILFYSRKIKDIRWAEKNKILWAVDTIPEDWLC